MIGGSIVAVLLLGARVEYAHSVESQRTELAAARRQIGRGPDFEKLWRTLAAAAYESGRDDPAPWDLLRKCDITVEVRKVPTPTPPHHLPGR